MTNTLSLSEIREQGIGNGFTVLNPADGYRKDNTLWFGNCANCGEKITNSSLKGIWEHKLIEKFDGHEKWTSIDYCPSV